MIKSLDSLYIGQIVSFQKLGYGNSGKEFVKFTCESEERKKVGDKYEMVKVPVEFAAFNQWARKVEFLFEEGLTCIVIYRPCSKQNGQYTNVQLNVHEVHLFKLPLRYDDWIEHERVNHGKAGQESRRETRSSTPPNATPSQSYSSESRNPAPKEGDGLPF